MKKSIIAIFVSFTLLWYGYVLAVSILTIIRNIDERSWQWFVMHPQPRNFLLNFLFGIVVFALGVVINIFIVHIKKLEKKTVLRLLVILVVMLVAIDQISQLIIARHHETIGVIPLVEGWLEINVQQLAEHKTVPARLLSLGITASIIFFLFRVVLHLCPSKSFFYASSVFFIAGAIASISSIIFHNMGYVFIRIIPTWNVDIHNIYFFIGVALFLQGLFVNPKSVKPVTTKDMLGFLRYELGLVKNLFVKKKGD